MSAPDDGVEDAIRLAKEVLDRHEPLEDRKQAEAWLEQVNGYLDTIRVSDPSNAWLPYLYGQALARAGRAGAAIDQLRKFVGTREGRNEWRAFRLLGDLFVTEFPQLAKANYRKARELNPGQVDVILGLSRCALKLGATAEALSLAREAVAADGRASAEPTSHLARTLAAAGQTAEALREARAALDLAKRDIKTKPGRRAPLLVVDLQYQLLIEVIRARIGEGTADVRKSPNFDAERFAKDYVSLAKYMREKAGNAQYIAKYEVLRVLESGVEATAPNTPAELLEQYGSALADVGHRDAAVDVFQQLLSSDPSNTVAKEWLVRLNVAPAD